MDLLAENDERCAVMKIKMTHIVGSPKAVSIDRIDNLKGYIKGNVQLVCQFYNYGKNDCKDDDVRSLMREAIDVNQACQV